MGFDFDFDISDNFHEEKIDYVTFREVIELFVDTTIGELQRETEIPRVDFEFSDDGLTLIKDVKDNPFVKKGFYTPNITDEDINLLNNKGKNSINIKVHDARLFFNLLTNIINESLNLDKYYYGAGSGRSRAMAVLRRIWLRMNVSDIDNIESFLKTQLSFIKDRTLDSKKESILTKYGDYFVLYQTRVLSNLYESTRKMDFKLSDGKNAHDLSSILYDIKEENGEKVCYISAVQKPRDSLRDKSIERKLYKINSLSQTHTSGVHPNMSTSMILFYDLLRSKGITHIKVPLYQVLSYDYHILLANKAREDFERDWSDDTLKYMSEIKDNSYFKLEYENMSKRYKFDKEWLEHLDGKEDEISYAKTNNLSNLFVFMSDIGASIINDIVLDDTMYLDISINKDEKLSR